MKGIYRNVALDTIKSVNNMGHKAKITTTLFKFGDNSPAVLISKLTLATDNFQIFDEAKVKLVKTYKGARLYRDDFSLKLTTLSMIFRSFVDTKSNMEATKSDFFNAFNDEMMELIHPGHAEIKQSLEELAKKMQDIHDQAAARSLGERMVKQTAKLKEEPKRDSEYTLKDGRVIYKSHNGFRFWCVDTKGETTEVTEQYWRKAFNNRNK